MYRSLKESKKHFKEVSHLKAIQVVRSKILEGTPNDIQLKKKLNMSSRVLDYYDEEQKASSSCYRRRSAREDEAYSILCELCI